MSRFLQAKLENKRLQTYKTSSDNLTSTISLLYNNSPSYIKNATVELWFNYTGSWIKYEDAVTDDEGVVHVTHNVSNLSGINMCLGQAKITHNGTVYNSNYTRYNFTYQVMQSYIIDAGTCVDPGSLDRSSYSLIDASGRTGRIYDRMI